MATKLTVYKNALLNLGERPISALTENVPSRLTLDQIWDAGFVKDLLEKGLWNFAIRSVEGAASTDFTPPFGYRYAYDKPSDYVRTAAVCEDEFFNAPLIRYEDEANYWFADIEPLYIRYVSDDTAYGGDLSKWPGTFARYAEMELAKRASRRITQSKSDLQDIQNQARKLLADARSKDAMNEPPRFPPRGSWSSARLGSRSIRQGTEGLTS